jgi:hypothetical protein
MWEWNNVKVKYANPVASTFGEEITIPRLVTYVKSKYALMEVIREFVENSYEMGPYTDIDTKTIKYDKPIKV